MANDVEKGVNSDGSGGSDEEQMEKSRQEFLDKRRTGSMKAAIAPRVTKKIRSKDRPARAVDTGPPLLMPPERTNWRVWMGVGLLLLAIGMSVALTIWLSKLP